MNKIIKIIKTRVLIDFFISMFFILSSCRNSCEIGNIIAYPAEADSVDMKQSGLLCKHPTITIGAINFQNNDLLEVKLVKKDKGVAILLFFIKNGRVHKVKSQIIDKDKIYALGASKDICEYYSNNKKWFLLISCKNDIVYIVWNKKEAGMCPFYMNSKHDYIYRKIRVKGVNFHVL